jgi:tetratricopeptide (TPR) repeat protein
MRFLTVNSRSINLLAIVAVSCATSTMSLHAQHTEWEALNAESVSLYDKGEYKRAFVVAKQALELAEKTYGNEDPRVGTSLGELGLLYKTLGNYAQAEPLYKRSLAIEEKSFGPLGVAHVLEGSVQKPSSCRI